MNIAPLSDHIEFIDEIAQLHQSEWAHLSSLPSAEARRDALKRCTASEGMPSVYIAFKNNEFIASAALIEHDLETHPDLSPWLAAVYVKEKWRGRGVATSLINHCELKAKELGITTLYLSTEHAMGLYAGLGWETIERCEYKKTTLDVMRRHLSP